MSEASSAPKPAQLDDATNDNTIRVRHRTRPALRLVQTEADRPAPSTLPVSEMSAAVDDAPPCKPAKGDYDVGFGKPPKATQFKKGQSGNVKGRPKGSKNFATILQEQLSAKIAVKIDGVTKQRTVAEVIVQQQIAKALKADTKAFALLTGYAAKREVLPQPPLPHQTEEHVNLDATERTMLAHYHREQFEAEGMSDDMIRVVLAAMGLGPSEAK